MDIDRNYDVGQDSDEQSSDSSDDGGILGKECEALILRIGEDSNKQYQRFHTPPWISQPLDPNIINKIKEMAEYIDVIGGVVNHECDKPLKFIIILTMSRFPYFVEDNLSKYTDVKIADVFEYESIIFDCCMEFDMIYDFMIFLDYFDHASFDKPWEAGDERASIKYRVNASSEWACTRRIIRFNAENINKEHFAHHVFSVTNSILTGEAKEMGIRFDVGFNYSVGKVFIEEKGWDSPVSLLHSNWLQQLLCYCLSEKYISVAQEFFPEYFTINSKHGKTNYAKILIANMINTVSVGIVSSSLKPYFYAIAARDCRDLCFCDYVVPTYGRHEDLDKGLTRLLSWIATESFMHDHQEEWIDDIPQQSRSNTQAERFVLDMFKLVLSSVNGYVFSMRSAGIREIDFITRFVLSDRPNGLSKKNFEPITSSVINAIRMQSMLLISPLRCARLGRDGMTKQNAKSFF